MRATATLLQASASYIPLADNVVQCVVTSPPYYSLREYAGEQQQTWGGDPEHCHEFMASRPIEAYVGRTRWQHSENGGGRYGGEVRRSTRTDVWATVTQGGYCACGAWRGALGLEPVPDCGAWALAFGMHSEIAPCADCYICHMVVIFREVRRVMRPDATCWLNIGDSYASKARGSDKGWDQSRLSNPGYMQKALGAALHMQGGQRHRGKSAGFKEKDLMMIPSRLALALQTDGWWVRADIIWNKTNPMPDSTTDRPTRSHENIFLLSKSKRYYYDPYAILEPISEGSKKRIAQASFHEQQGGPKDARNTDGGSRKHNASARTAVENLAARVSGGGDLEGRNAWSVWTMPTQRYPGAHFACVDAATEALTWDGWKRQDELQDGEHIAAYDDGVLRWEPATFHRYDYDGELVAIDKRDSSQRLTPNHRVLVRHRAGARSTHVVRADELTAAMAIPTAAPFAVDQPATVGGVAWASLLGWYIAEGSSHHSGYVYIYQSETANPGHVATIRGLLDTVGAVYQERVREREWRGRPSTEHEWSIRGDVALRLQALAPGKHMSPKLAVLRGDEAQALLDALIDGDGHRRPDGRSSIIQKSRPSIDAMQMLAIRLGYRAIIGPHGDGYSLYLTQGDWLTLRSTNGRHDPIGREHYTGTVWCPSVPSGFWLARRDGKPFITGNTFPEDLPRRAVLAGSSWKACGVCRAPWRRDVAHIRMVDGEPAELPPARNTSKATPSGAQGVGHGRITTERRMEGWVRTCKHTDDPGDGLSLVLDPFNGTGTSGVVAMRYGRSYIGLDVSAEYLNEQAAARINNVQHVMEL